MKINKSIKQQTPLPEGKGWGWVNSKKKNRVMFLKDEKPPKVLGK